MFKFRSTYFSLKNPALQDSYRFLVRIANLFRNYLLCISLVSIFKKSFPALPLRAAFHDLSNPSPPKRAKKKSYVSESFTCSASLFSVFNSSARLSSENSYRSNSCVLVSFTSIRCRIYASTSNSFFLS